MKQYFALGAYTEDILFGTGEVFHGQGRGISICAFEDGQISFLTELPVRNPSFLCIEEKYKKIYAVNEMKEFKGQFGGGLTQISYEDPNALKTEADFPTMGTDPCHVEISPDKTFLSVANFASGAVTVFPLDSQGNISGAGTLYQHEGHSVHPVRQKGPHAHSTVFAPDRNVMYVPDLGLDKVMAYEYCGGKLSLCDEAIISVPAGSGPRFGEFDSAGKNFYLIDEIGSRVQRFAYEDGKMIPRETVETLPDGFEGNNICSDLHLTPDGKWLYASNRGHDSLACFSLDAEGKMTFAGRYACGGRTPRNFAVEPSGRYILVGNQDSDNISVFSIGKDGELTFVSSVNTGSPVCIRFFKADPV